MVERLHSVEVTVVVETNKSREVHRISLGEHDEDEALHHLAARVAVAITGEDDDVLCPVCGR